MATDLESERTTDELLAQCARLALERDELAQQIGELERELATLRRPGDGAKSESRTGGLGLWLAVALSTLVTVAVVVGGAAIVSGFWHPLGSEGARPPVPSPAPPSPAPLERPAAAPSEEDVAVAAPPPATPSTPTRAKLRITAARGDSWLEVRRRSAAGTVLYTGILTQGRALRLTGKRLWLRFAIGEHLEVTVNGRPVERLPHLAADARVTRKGLTIAGVG
jgi:Domain of unknown function (DUF4115)